MLEMIDKLRGRYGRPASMRRQVDAFRKVFGTDAAKSYVIPALAEFCGAADPLPSDPQQMARAAGRRDVFLFIQRHVHFTPEQVFAMLRGDRIPVTDDRSSL